MVSDTEDSAVRRVWTTLSPAVAVEGTSGPEIRATVSSVEAARLVEADSAVDVDIGDACPAAAEVNSPESAAVGVGSGLPEGAAGKEAPVVDPVVDAVVGIADFEASGPADPSSV